jgi:DNA-binding transcriptional LysR family regulator
MSRITFHLAEIVAFVAVAEKLNFRAAAESLHISQPALSRRIAKLEQLVGTRLFERTTQRVSLTEAGEKFREHAKAAIKELELGMSGVTESTVRRGGLVTLACVSSLTNSVLPRILKTFAEHHPLVRVRVIDESVQNAMSSVASGAADFGVSLLGAPEPDIAFQAIYTEDYVLAAHIDHALARRRSVSWEELADEKFIAVTKESDNQILIDKVLLKLPRRPSVFYEASHVAGALGMVEAGLGVTAVPRATLSQDARKSIVGIPLTGPALHRTIGLIFRKGKQLPPPAMALYELLKSPHSIL